MQLCIYIISVMSPSKLPSAGRQAVTHVETFVPLPYQQILTFERGFFPSLPGIFRLITYCLTSSSLLRLYSFLIFPTRLGPRRRGMVLSVRPTHKGKGEILVNQKFPPDTVLPHLANIYVHRYTARIAIFTWDLSIPFLYNA